MDDKNPTLAIIDYIEARLAELEDRRNNPGTGNSIDFMRARWDARDKLYAAFDAMLTGEERPK